MGEGPLTSTNLGWLGKGRPRSHLCHFRSEAPAPILHTTGQPPSNLKIHLMHEEKCCLVCRIFLDKTLQDSVKSMSSNVSPNMCRLYPQYILDMWHISFTQVQSCSQGKYTGSFSGGQVSIIAHFFIIYVCIIAHRSYYHHQTSFSRCYEDWGVLA